MAQLQNSGRVFEWAAGKVAPWQHEHLDGQWSAHQQLFHLIATEKQVYFPRLERMLAEEAPKFLFWDDEAFMRDNYSRAPDIQDLAAQFVDERAKTVDLLKGAGREDWSRQATWPDGKVIDLAWLGERVLWHGLDHLATILDIHSEKEALQVTRWMRRAG